MEEMFADFWKGFHSVVSMEGIGVSVGFLVAIVTIVGVIVGLTLLIILLIERFERK